MRIKESTQSSLNQRKEWECTKKENKIRTNLLLVINKETQQALSSESTRINSKKPRDIVAEYEQYEIIINTPLIIGNKRTDVIVSDNYHRNSARKANATQHCPFTAAEVKLFHKKTIGEAKPGLAKKKTASFAPSPRDDCLFPKSPSSKSKTTSNLIILQHIAFRLISKPIPRLRILRRATKHDTMGMNETKVMKRFEQITFREETSFYNDFDDMHAIDMDVYDEINRASNEKPKINYQRNMRQRSKTEQLGIFNSTQESTPTHVRY